MRLLKYFSILFVAVCLVLYLGQRRQRYQVMSGQTMGTYYNIKIRTDRENNLLHNVLKTELERINSQMSVFDSSSEISQINSTEKDIWIDLSPEMSQVLKEAYEVYTQSNGAFDPTVGRLIDLWGFGAGHPTSIPEDEEIKKVLKYTGFNKIKFNNNFSKLKKLHSDSYLNLSALAKGYGVDCIAKMLKKIGYKNYVVEIGGEVVTSGKRDDMSDGWNIGISNPTSSNEDSETAYVITLKDFAVATSGDYRNFFVLNNKKYSHTISSKTGYPVENNLASATVFNKSCMNADAYATALMALGEDKGLNFANNNKLAVVLFVRNEDGTVSTKLSKEAKKIIGEE